MNNDAKKMAEAISKNLRDEPQDKVLIMTKRENATVWELDDIVDGKYKTSGESFDVVGSIEEENPEISDGHDFDKSGYYVFKFHDKELVDFQFIETSNDINIDDSEACAVVLNKLYNLVPTFGRLADNLERLLQEENIFNKDNNNLAKSGLSYDGVEIKISRNFAESRERIRDDLKLLDDKTMNRIMKEQFLPWLKGDNFNDKDDAKILEGLKLYEVAYYADDSHSKFTFSFESKNDYTKKMLQAVDMVITIRAGRIIEEEVNCYDV